MINDDIETALMGLVERGLVNVTYNEDLEALFTISDEGKKVVESLGANLEW